MPPQSAGVSNGALRRQTPLGMSGGCSPWLAPLPLKRRERSGSLVFYLRVVWAEPDYRLSACSRALAGSPLALAAVVGPPHRHGQPLRCPDHHPDFAIVFEGVGPLAHQLFLLGLSGVCLQCRLHWLRAPY